MAEIRMKLRPIQTPNFVGIEGTEQTIAVKDLPATAARELAIEWLRDFYRKAGLEPDWRFE